MKLVNMPTIDDGMFVDYFLNRADATDFQMTFNAPAQAIQKFKLDNLYNLLKYAFFNDTTNFAGAHHLLLEAKCVIANITLPSYGYQQVSIANILPNSSIVSYHCNPVSPADSGILPIITPLPESPSTALCIMPTQLRSDVKSPISFELLIFVAENKVKQNLIYSLLSDAFAYCQKNNYRYAIIAAHNAYELAAKDYITRLSKQFTFNADAAGAIKNLDRELISVISNKYLPIITSVNNKPMPPKLIKENILKLTRQRNALNHSLSSELRADKSMLYDFVLSTFFICKYFQLDIPHKDYPKESFASTHPCPKDGVNTILSIWK